MSAHFPTTRWSIVSELSNGSPERARAALDTLCNQYREPLLRFLLLAKIADQNDVDDLIQDFLSFFVEKESFSRADQKRGRLRTFLIGSLKNFASNVRARNSAAKRGGGESPVPLSEVTTEPSYDPEIEKTFDRAWAVAVMEGAIEVLAKEYSKRGKESWYGEISKFLELSGEPVAYDEIAKRLEVRPNRVALEVFRLRRRFREIIREEVGRTVEEQGDIEEELRYLARVLGNSSMA